MTWQPSIRIRLSWGARVRPPQSRSHLIPDFGAQIKAITCRLTHTALHEACQTTVPALAKCETQMRMRMQKFS